jgi:tripartite-type tricarboxylate transporter receptor subunit TctC
MLTGSGYPGFDTSNFFGFFAPAGTPKDIIDKLLAAAVKALASPDLQERFATQGAEVGANKPAETIAVAMAMVKADIAKWVDVQKKPVRKLINLHSKI